MVRISFRQGMVAGFLLIVVLLGGAALRSWLVVEHFVAQSRSGNERAVQLSTSLQELAERTVDVERSARQSLVLDDPLFRQRFDDSLTQALTAVARLEEVAPPLAQPLGQWREGAAALREGLDHHLAGSELSGRLARLGSLNSELNQAGRRWLEAQNGLVLAELEAHRMQLGGVIAFAVAGALAVATVMGWWLVWPIRRLEQAIERLGEHRLADAVAVGGPADLRRLGRRVDWLRLRLADLEADRERTLRHVSHELKTPLTALREGVALLQEEVPGPLVPAQQEVVGILRHNVLALQGRIESLLTLNATASEARRLDYRPVALAEFLTETAGRREMQWLNRGLHCQVNAPPANVVMDREKMAVVVDNLLSNAIDFSPSGGEIHLSAEVEARGWRLDCADQGPGVAAEDAERIFEPFVQGRRGAPAPRRGSGVGLSIVRELVRAMGGEVTLVPATTGAHFRVRLPRVKEEEMA